jgi:very-short-patch-repair endonuclease
VTVWGADHRRPGIRVHRVSAIGPDEVTRRDGIPVTTAARTLLDLAGTTPLRELERALEEALAKRLTSRAGLVTLLRRYPLRAGVGRLRTLLDSAKPAVTRSEGERQLLALIRKARLPEPETNVVVAGHEVDFFWRDERFVAEFDGFTFHAAARKFERDRQRDAELVAAGVRIVRITWHQLVNEPEALLIRLALALTRPMRP